MGRFPVLYFPQLITFFLALLPSWISPTLSLSLRTCVSSKDGLVVSRSRSSWGHLGYYFGVLLQTSYSIQQIEGGQAMDPALQEIHPLAAILESKSWRKNLGVVENWQHAGNFPFGYKIIEGLGQLESLLDGRLPSRSQLRHTLETGGLSFLSPPLLFPPHFFCWARNEQYDSFGVVVLQEVFL